MPIFEYRCNACSHVTSFLELSRAPRDHACGKCGSKDTKKMFSTFAPKMGKSGAAPKESCSSCPSGSCPYAGAGMD